jgi:hypothetical protein
VIRRSIYTGDPEKVGIPILEDVGKVVKGTVKGVGSGLEKFIDSVTEEGSARTIVDENLDVDADNATSDDTGDADLFMDY